MLHLVLLRFGAGGYTESGGTGALAPYIGLGCDELKQIERDIFGAARRVGGFHEVVPLSLSLMLMAAMGCAQMRGALGE
jgi:hypothetical protein